MNRLVVFMIELVHFRVLDTLHRCGSLAAAADALHVTQPALSHAIKKLEQHYGLRVWERDGRRLRLTQAGEYLLQLGGQVLPLIQQADETLKAYSEGRRGKLRIGMECHPCYEWLLRVVEPFLERWPDVDLDVIQRFRFNGFEALLNHHIDMLVTSDPLQDDRLVNTGVFDYELRLVVASAHHLAQRSTVEPLDLKQETLFTFPVARDRLDVYTRFLMPASIEPHRQISMETTEVMLQLVAARRGVCTLPGWLIDRFQQSYAIKGVRLGERGVHKTLYLTHRKTDAAIAYINDFVALGQN